MQKIRIHTFLFIAFSLIATTTSCDIFSTRDAQDPDQARSNNQPAVQPTIVIVNLINSLIDKNVQDYMSCFVDSLFSSQKFTFSASGEVASNYPIFLQGWGLSEEQRYITSVLSKINKDYPISLTFNDENFSSLSGDSLIYTATYFLNVPIAAEGQSSVNYSGNLQFNMLRDSRSIWVIYLWKDTKSQTLPSWSELKGNNY